MSEPTPKKRIAIHGAPRSGTTWVEEIFNSSPATICKYQPLFSHALKGRLSPDSSREEIDDFFAALESTPDEFMDRTLERAGGAFPVFKKGEATHVVYKEVRYHHVLVNLLARCPEVRLVACIRNPLSVISSWLRAPREFRADLGWREREEWRDAPNKNQGLPEEFNGYTRWKECTRIFLALAERHPGRVRLLEYRRLLERPEAEVRALFDFSELALTDQTLDFLARSSTESHPGAYSVFRSGQSDDRWRTELSPDIAREVMDDLHGSELERFADP